MSPEVGRVERLAGHRPDRGCSGDRSKLGGVGEVKFAIEGAGVGERRLEITGAAFAISPLEHRFEELASKSLSLLDWLHSPQFEVPMRTARVLGCRAHEAAPNN